MGQASRLFRPIQKARQGNCLLYVWNRKFISKRRGPCIPGVESGWLPQCEPGPERNGPGLDYGYEPDCGPGNGCFHRICECRDIGFHVWTGGGSHIRFKGNCVPGKCNHSRLSFPEETDTGCCGGYVRGGRP